MTCPATLLGTDFGGISLSDVGGMQAPSVTARAGCPRSDDLKGEGSREEAFGHAAEKNLQSTKRVPVDVRTDGATSMSQKVPATSLRVIADARSVEEFKDAFAGWEEVEYARLAQAVAVFARIAWMEPLELVQEAVTRVLERRRRWPRDVPLATFLVSVARSVASGEKKYRERGEVRSPVSVYDRQGDVEHHGGEEGRSPEDEAIDKERLSLLEKDMEALFADDPVAEAVYMGHVDGLQGEELREVVDLGPTEFATKCRLVRRRLNSYSSKKGALS